MSTGGAAREDAIQVALATDANFLMPLAVSLRSLAQRHTPSELAVTILHDGLKDSEIARAGRGLDGLDVSWRRVDAEEVAGAHFSTFLTNASLFRILLPRILPEHDRVIYLDSDTIFARSLRPLWETDLEGNLLGAVRDAGAPFPVGPLGTIWRELGLAPDTPYFNTGVMVIPLGVWRSEAIGDRTLEILRRTRPPWGDQDGLNAAVAGSWLELSRRWNLQTPDAKGDSLAWALWREDAEAAVEDPAVIHFSERDKPWHHDCGHPLVRRWYETLDGTAWSGWRPRSPHRIHRRVASRVTSAGRMLVTGRPRVT
jgi:lipopolysaccharide biosynthesis glycosyltransferase